jgi:CubicO group peptidase (beta-lactamase class C family)
LLQRGQWNGQQIVPAQWVDASTTPQIAPPDNVAFYGYHWWLGRSLVGNREVSWFAGTGVGGQRICIVPALDLVVAMTGGSYKTPERVPPLAIFNRYVLAAVRGF